MNNSKSVILRLDNVGKRFGENVVLKNISMTVHRGEVVCIIGPSGSGKSTLLRCINFLEPPTDGTISFDGAEITTKANLYRVRREIGMVFQHFNLFPHRTALENVTEGLRFVLGLGKQEAEKLALEQLEKVGVVEKAHEKPASMSLKKPPIWC